MKKIVIIILKVILTLAFLTLSQYLSMVAIQDIFPDVLLTFNVIQFFSFVILYKLLFRNFLNTKVDLIILLSLLPFLVSIGAFINKSTIAYPYEFPCNFIVKTSCILIAYFFERKKIIYLIAVLLFAIGIDNFYFPNYSFNRFKLETPQNSVLTNARFVKPNGDTFFYSAANYKYTLLDIGFISCLPCRVKEKQLEKLTAYYKDKNVLILKVNPVDDWKSFSEHYLNYSKKIFIAKDIDSSAYSLIKEQGFPQEFIIDNKGKILKNYKGFGDGKFETIYYEETTHFIDSLLKIKN